MSIFLKMTLMNNYACLQIENLERDIHEKRRQMRVLEQRINESGEASIANASFVEMQQVVLRSHHLHYYK